MSYPDYGGVPDVRLKPCPFCGNRDVRFVWQHYPILGRFECECTAAGPQIQRHKKYDNDHRLISRAVKAWNEPKS